MSDRATGAFSRHLEASGARRLVPDDAFTGAAGGAACGDVVRVSLSIDHEDPDGRIADAGFDARGCGAAIAAGSAVVSLVRRAGLLDAARVGASEIAAELGGLIPGRMHAADLAADALHRALGAAARARAMLASCDRRIVVAMSGGVDSAVAALLCAREGRQVVGLTLELWSDAENDAERSCCSSTAARAARAIAHELGLAHLSLDLRAEFRAGVVEPWLAEHDRGLTPNPCIRCNGQVRLDAMVALAERLGAPALATGHYARLAAARPHQSAGGGADGGRGSTPLLRMAADAGKDQSYALAGLSPRTLARLRFPLAELEKPQVRRLAAEAGLAVAARRDSQDLCFLAGTGRARFLARHGRSAPRSGPIVDGAGRRLGTHAGHQTVTVGQRHGLGIGGVRPLFVLATDAASNTVVVGPREALRARRIRIEEVTLYRDPASVDAVRLRSRGARLRCRLLSDRGGDDGERAPGWSFSEANARGGARALASADGYREAHAGRTPRASLVVELEAPAERTAPGQLACLYSGELVVGRGTVARWDPGEEEPAGARCAPAGSLAGG